MRSRVPCVVGSGMFQSKAAPPAGRLEGPHLPPIALAGTVGGLSRYVATCYRMANSPRLGVSRALAAPAEALCAKSPMVSPRSAGSIAASAHPRLARRPFDTRHLPHLEVPPRRNAPSTRSSLVPPATPPISTPAKTCSIL